MQKSIKNIGFAGSGNVSWHLARNLILKGYTISGIWSREYSNAVALAKECNSVAYPEISTLCNFSDLIIIAVSDKAIADVARKIKDFEGIVVHTAGSVSMEIFEEHVRNYGVFYPLQTFSKDILIDLSEVPFFLEASSPGVLDAIRQVALNLSPNVYETDSNIRMLLHVAAVFAGNYTNLMYILGNEIVNRSQLPSNVLHPLITEIARKAVSFDPIQIQTGPARRHDAETIEKHIAALASEPEYVELYRLLANLISKKYK